ncbi:hypothetical protein V5799_033362 [Amblyomma americanum]|uniref:Alpha-macroglobulin receptor-binding domain-containing protein n=1 Tax=Amblyomma americanum TaxID=6943 RepID=A0AAQ4DNI7_AMBAM
MTPRCADNMRQENDTVVALQALSKYAIYARDDEIDMTCEVTQVEPREDNRGQPVFSRTLRINRRNADVRNRITFDLSVNFQRATVTVDRSPDLIGTGQKRESRYRMEVCARSLTKNITGMAILDVGLLTGFRAEVDDLQKLITGKLVDRFEHSSRSVVFYLPTIPEDKQVCISFGLKQEFGVAMLQSASVKVYAYYDPGTEGDLVNKTRTVKSRENCKSFNLTTDHEYIIMGMDAKYKEELHPCGEQ